MFMVHEQIFLVLYLKKIAISTNVCNILVSAKNKKHCHKPKDKIIMICFQFMLFPPPNKIVEAASAIFYNKNGDLQKCNNKEKSNLFHS